jgi:hypothetical protein
MSVYVCLYVLRSPELLSAESLSSEDRHIHAHIDAHI